MRSFHTKHQHHKMVITAVAKRPYPGIYKNEFMKWVFKIHYNYSWVGKKYGLEYHDTLWEPSPIVAEALRRYRLVDPYGYDLRQQRITRSVYLTSKKEELPKSQWTKLENDTFYLGTIIDEIQNEKLERAHTSGLKPGYELKPQL